MTFISGRHVVDNWKDPLLNQQTVVITIPRPPVPGVYLGPESDLSNKVTRAISITTIFMTSLAILLKATTHQWGWMFLGIGACGISVGNCCWIGSYDFEVKTWIVGTAAIILNLVGTALSTYLFNK